MFTSFIIIFIFQLYILKKKLYFVLKKNLFLSLKKEKCLNKPIVNYILPQKKNK